MTKIYKSDELDVTPHRSPFPDFSFTSSADLGSLANSKYLHFNLRSLPPDRFSYPYHSHRNAEELFVILAGEATLRTPEGYQRIAKGDIIFFEEGASSAHQLYNHGDAPCIYLDLRTKANIDVCDYPDSGKINILPAMDIFEADSRVDYYSGEEGVRDTWPEDIVG
jgi:uncharacterized cupin superfamily protein